MLSGRQPGSLGHEGCDGPDQYKRLPIFLTIPSEITCPPCGNRAPGNINKGVKFHIERMDLLDFYLPVAIFALIAISFPLGTFFLTRLVRPTNPTPLKDLTYECGEVPEGEANIQFHFQYYIFGLIFVLFDVAAIFLALWALVMAGAPLAERFSVLLPILGFIAILFVATQYALRKEAIIHI